MQNFKTLKVWEKGHELAVAVYKATAKFPKHEFYGLTSQIRRASASVPANIAEACGRGGGAEFTRFPQVSMGSASELEYHLLLARDPGFISEGEYRLLEARTIELKRMLIGKLRSRSSVSG